MIDRKTIQILEFDKILRLVAERAVSARSRTLIMETLPQNSMQEVQFLLDRTEEMYYVYNKYNLAPIVPFDDITESLKKAGMGAVLNPAELLKISRMIRSARIAKKEILGSGEEIRYLKEAVSVLFIASELEKAIGDAIAGETEIKDSASDALRLLRRKIANADARLKEKLAGYTRASNLTKYLQDSIVTVRNGRFVLPVRSECRGDIPGLIHDQSASGATVFIEPLPIVELNNELKSLQMEELREVERILKALSEMTANYINSLENCQETCTMLDIIYAKMQFSVDFRASKPLLNEKGIVDLKQARHPLIDRDSVVHVDLSFGGEYKILLITGPNTGGKTVCLKIAGLFCIMACCGLFLPCAAGSSVSVFDGIYPNIGDDQSILNSLSTFSSHILNISRIADKVTARSLILLDELGGGTDPAEGSALAVGVIQYLEKKGACGIITTHYGELKQYAMLSKTVINGCMRFDEDSLKPVYQLLIGIPGASHALKIARSLGLNPEILENANNAVGECGARFEEILARTEEIKAEAIKERDNAAAYRIKAEEELRLVEKERAALQLQRERLQENARTEVRRIVGNSIEKANELIERIACLTETASEKSLLEAKRLRTQLEELKYAEYLSEMPQKNLRPLLQNELKIGMTVYAAGYDTPFSVLSLPDKKGDLFISHGGAKLKVSVSKLSLAALTLKPQRPSVKPVVKLVETVEFAPSIVEIKMLGMTVSEAIEELQSYFVSNIGRNITLKIVHGKGTGALGKGIQQYLRAQKNYVKAIRYGGYGEGDRGVTFAELI